MECPSLAIELRQSVESCGGELLERRDFFRSLWTAVGSPHTMHRLDYFVLYSLCRSFAPDLILELGRARGNSTCALREAARVGGCARMVSV